MSVLKDMNRDDLESLTKNLLYLIIECQDALPTITLTVAKLRNIDLSLADRIEACLIPFETTEDDPNGI